MRTDAELIDQIENADDGQGPTPVVSVTDPELAQIHVALIEVNAAEHRLDQAVQAARASGHTWQAIGDILGLTRQGILKRYQSKSA